MIEVQLMGRQASTTVGVWNPSEFGELAKRRDLSSSNSIEFICTMGLVVARVRWTLAQTHIARIERSF
jgi:hypothetical protein